MITTLSGFLIVLFGSFILVQSRNNVRPIRDLKQTKIPTAKIKDSLVYDGYVLRVESTCLMDSVSYLEKRLFNPVIIMQRLIFLKNNKVLNVVVNKSKKIYQKVSGGSKVLMLSNVYATAYVVKGKYKTAFAVSGYGGCNSCSETLDFFTLEGVPAYKADSPNEWERFLKYYGIGNYNKSDIEIILYPPSWRKYIGLVSE